jgi:uncharacterized protein (TIGR02246 family)
VLIFLAAGALLGYLAASGRFLTGPEAIAAPAGGAQETKQPGEAILITLRLPADAVLEIDDYKTNSTGAVRTFQTPPLPADGHYSYTLKATSQGKEVSRKIDIAHGVDNSFDLRAEFKPAAKRKADSRQITTVGYGPARGSTPGSGSGVGQAERSKGDPKDEAAIAANAEAFIAAFQKGDARALAAFWAPEGMYTDLTGRQLQGREAIEKAFTEFFANNKGLKVGISSESLQFITPDVAVEEGVSEVFPADGGPPSRARFHNVHAKKSGQWLLSSVKDSVSTPASNYGHLRGLEWAIGEWASDNTQGPVEHISLSWTETQNFIIGSFSTSVKNVSVGSAKQWIGWDPHAMRIRSWSFDDTGAFGEGTWTQEGDMWVIKSSTVLQDGKKATATYIIGHANADTITLASKDRTVDGNALPEIKEVKLKRMK